MINNQVLVTGAVVFNDSRRKRYWFITKSSEEDGWELPKAVVRNTESSVRAGIRMMSEKGGMGVRVLEEAGRAGGTTTVNGRVVPQRHLYYLMKQKRVSGEAIGFPESKWVEYADAVRKLSSKREKTMLRQANKELKKWEKAKALRGKRRYPVRK
jgi:hypothetical protein